MKKHIANIITGCRIVCSIWLLFMPAFSHRFYLLYLLCGFTDMIDGPVARKTKSVTVFGSGLDSIADFVFVVAVFIKLLPTLNIPIWLWNCIFVIVVVKIINLILGFLRNQRLIFEHTAMNKLTGLLLFLLPLTMSFIDLKYSANVVWVIAACSAIQEGYYIKTGREVAS